MAFGAFGASFKAAGGTAALAVLVASSGVPGRADPAEAPAPARAVVFGSLDGGSSAFLAIGAKRALAGSLDESGPVAMLHVGAGGSPERLGTASVGEAAFRPTLQGSALAGYQWSLGRVFVSAFAGAEFDRDRFPSAGGVARETTRFGARIQGEVWMHPTDDTLVTGTAIAGSARGHLWARASGGYKAWRDVFIGPEATHYRTETYREWRLGVHATGIRVGSFTLRISGGWRGEEAERRRGGYGALSAYVRM